jgi:hypothetical protein
LAKSTITQSCYWHREVSFDHFVSAGKDLGGSAPSHARAAKDTALVSDTTGWRADYRVHPAAQILPMMPDPEIAELGDKIAEDGPQESIALWVDNTAEKDRDDSIKPVDYPRWLIDGRNRLETMQQRGLDLNTVRCVGNAANAKKQERQPVLSHSMHGSDSLPVAAPMVA